MLLKDKVCLVTGANRGIGAAITKQFANEGATVYAVARKQSSLKGVVNAINSEREGSVIELYFDITDTAAAKQAIMQIKKEQSRLDVLVNNAGIMRDALIGMIPKSQMVDIFETNVYATIEMIQLASKLMLKQRSGSIINFASIVGTSGSAGQTVYSASKGAVIALTKSAAKELASYNIRVNAVAPGMIETELFLSYGEEKVAEHLKTIGFNRLGTPEEVADVCVFLASDLSRYVTGQIIGVDGQARI